MNNINKNDIVDIIIDDIGVEGQGIGKVDGFTLFVKGGLPGERLSVKVLKVKKQYGYAKILSIIEKSRYRVDWVCPVFGRCGGCTLQHLGYKQQLKAKEKKINDVLVRIGGFKDISVSGMIGMESPFYYRNKAQFPIGKNENGAFVGFYSQKSHNIVHVKKCFIQDEKMCDIMTIFEKFINENDISVYDEELGSGLIRHLLIRTGFKTGEIMVCIVINGVSMPFVDVLAKQLSVIKGMTSISLNRNEEKTNVILGNEITIVWGRGYIKDFIGKYQFEISPISFYQVNPVQTEKLYKKAIELGKIDKNSIVFDAFCGIGTISLFAARNAKVVYGVEIVPEAVLDAKSNAVLNCAKNVSFFVGESEVVIPNLVDEGIKPDVIFIDPPRKGCGVKLLEAIIIAEVSRIVYVSCDPATLARDLKILQEGGYHLKEVWGFDCFPMTSHVESVALMVRE